MAEVEDERGLTTGGIGHVPPEFIPPSPAAAATGRKASKSGRSRPFPTIQVPLPSISVSPEDLDLDSTIKAGQSFGSSSSGCREDRPGGLQQESSRNYNGNSAYGTSYARAVNGGMVDSMAMGPGCGGSQLVCSAATALALQVYS